MEHSAHIEVTAGVVRVFGPGKSYGSKYDWAASLRWMGPDTVEFLGALRAPTWQEHTAMAIKLREMGVRFVVIKRIRADGSERSSKLSIEER